jgi:folylpolyglutamate synthase
VVRQDAIVALNSLQPNAVELNKSIQLRQHQKHDDANFNLTDTEKFLERIDGFTMKSLERLSVIHVAGSKGKGSVCTFTDAILREHNIKTGLFTSPHLVSVTERIKLRGTSISKQLFTEYFWEVFDALQRKKDNELDLPSYFKFLQIMAFYIFVKENVDVAIVEVGIGGEYDSTNIIRNTEIVGITSLQLEHTQLLGETLDEIAWQKAGIIKANSHVFTMSQPEVCMQVINKRFNEKKVRLKSNSSCIPQCFHSLSGQIVIGIARVRRLQLHKLRARLHSNVRGQPSQLLSRRPIERAVAEKQRQNLSRCFRWRCFEAR